MMMMMYVILFLLKYHPIVLINLFNPQGDTEQTTLQHDEIDIIFEYEKIEGVNNNKIIVIFQHTLQQRYDRLQSL